MRKTKLLSMLALLLLAVTAHAEEVTGVTYLYYANQAAAIAQTPSTSTANCTKVEASSEVVTWNSGWYVVNEDVTISARVDIVGEVNLILADGATLTTTACINTNGATLNIYGQTLGTGTLNASSTNGPAAIGGRGAKDGGTLTIHGGIINATGGNYKGAGAAGIGGGCYNNGTGGNGGTITINGGKITATSGYGAAGIGGSAGAHCGVITINGGTVIATGPEDGEGPGIGNGLDYQGTDGQVIINGGTVTATGSLYGAGIGGGQAANGGTVTITGGDVTAIGIAGAGIGGGSQRGGNVTITGGTVRAYSQALDSGPWIGAGLCDGFHSSSPGTLTLGDEILVKAAQVDESTDWEALPVVARESFLTNHSMRRVYIEPLKILDETADNQTWLTENNAQERNITLTRTLQTGSYNTFCAPFAIPASKYADYKLAAVKKLTASSFDNTTGVLSLTFADETTGIEAGKPYLVKVSEAVTNPTFVDVTVSGTAVPNTETETVNFVPTLSKTLVMGDGSSADDAKTVLFLGAQNKLYNPTVVNDAAQEASYIKGFRAYFQLKGEATAARSFSLDFGDGEVSGINELYDSPSEADAWYTLDGRKLQGRPNVKGIYIINGKKTIVK